MNTCDKCAWWATKEPMGTNRQRPCLNKSCNNEGPDGMSPDDGYGTIETGPKFGCIHHKQKPE